MQKWQRLASSSGSTSRIHLSQPLAASPRDVSSSAASSTASLLDEALRDAELARAALVRDNDELRALFRSLEDGLVSLTTNAMAPLDATSANQHVTALEGRMEKLVSALQARIDGQQSDIELEQLEPMRKQIGASRVVCRERS